MDTKKIADSLVMAFENVPDEEIEQWQDRLSRALEKVWHIPDLNPETIYFSQMLFHPKKMTKAAFLERFEEFATKGYHGPVQMPDDGDGDRAIYHGEVERLDWDPVQPGCEQYVKKHAADADKWLDRVQRMLDWIKWARENAQPALYFYAAACQRFTAWPVALVGHKLLAAIYF